MFIMKSVPKRVYITKDISTMAGTFTKGHEFNVIGSSPRGLDLEDDAGNRLLEIGLSSQSIKIMIAD